ncbi:MAG TPA: antitoxin [Caulobacteraceae bacterium]
MIVKLGRANSQLARLVAAFERGEEIIIARGDKPVAKFTAVETAPRTKRIFGSLKGHIALTDAFFEPLPDDELALWNGEGD